jgi:hypothetical protein
MAAVMHKDYYQIIYHFKNLIMVYINSQTY